MAIVNSFFIPGYGIAGAGLLVTQTDANVVAGTNSFDGSVTDATTLANALSAANSALQASPTVISNLVDLTGDLMLPEIV